MRLFTTLLILSGMIWVGCQKDMSSNPTSSETSKTGKLKIYLTDAPPVAKFDAVNIKFSQVSAHLDSSWITVQGDPMTVNLLDLVNGNTIAFGSSDVPAGKYTQIRIIIDDAWTVINGEKKPLTVPSGAKTGLKLGPEFSVKEGSTYELIVDFDVSRSIVITGPPKDPGYKLKPHLRIMPLATSGSISGIVTNPDSLATAYAIQNSDTTTSTLVDSATGFFKLAFLPAGFYTVSVKDTTNKSVNIDNVQVIAGKNNDLGSITLF